MAYFVAAEALANAAKHAHATTADVEVRLRGGMLRVRITDDGIGGADASLGSGLRGLSDRVAAVRGRLRVDTPPDGGTRVTADLPCPP